MSYNNGETASFKIKTTSMAYHIDIYRTGYYGNLGARRVARIYPLAPLPQTQPACISEASTGLYDCGNWSISASWGIPDDAVSGVYLAKLVRDDVPSGGSHITFVVRDDSSHSDLVFQTSDQTVQAYNNYGGKSLYQPTQATRAKKVSFNRPTNPDIMVLNAWYLMYEFPLAKFLEANGYDVTYVSGVDTDRRGQLLPNHKVFLSVGHDEYWSGNQRAYVTAARNAGTHLAFFSGNLMFWKTAFENSIDGSNSPYRTLVCRKETHDNAPASPPSPWTGTWRDNRFSTEAVPENALTGTLFMVNEGYRKDRISIPASDGRMRFWRNTSVAAQPEGSSMDLPTYTLGFEWDVDADNSYRPAGLIHLSATTVPITTPTAADNPRTVIDYGSTFDVGSATHNMTMYRHGSGALVFSFGTIGWQYGLATSEVSQTVPDCFFRIPPMEDVRIKQATVNLLADMGVQPQTPASGLASADPSGDQSGPTSQIFLPQGQVMANVTATVYGSAADLGGVVGGVEVSTDGGSTWHPATGRENWRYDWTPTSAGPIGLVARATDDSGNTGPVSAPVSVTAASYVPRCSIVDIVPLSSSPRVVGEAPEFQANSTCNGPAELKWWIDKPGIGWVQATNWRPSEISGETFGRKFTWRTSFLPPGDYRVGVWVRVIGTNPPGGFDQAPAIPFSLTVASCTSVTITPSAPSPQPAGATYEFTAQPSCNTTAEYRWWIRNLDGIWTLARDWNQSSSFYWNIVSLPPSNPPFNDYYVGVWVRGAGSSSDPSHADVAPAISYTLAQPTANACMVSIGEPTGCPPSVTFAASVTCSGPTEYRWFVAPPGGTWSVVQEWNSASTFSWTPPAPPSAGDYLIGVWVRKSGAMPAESSSVRIYPLRQ